MRVCLMAKDTVDLNWSGGNIGSIPVRAWTVAVTV